MKKHPNRFTLSFNLKNPQHNEAIEALNKAGKQKADLVAELFAKNKESERQIDKITKVMASMLDKQTTQILGMIQNNPVKREAEPTGIVLGDEEFLNNTEILSALADFNLL